MLASALSVSSWIPSPVLYLQQPGGNTTIASLIEDLNPKLVDLWKRKGIMRFNHCVLDQIQRAEGMCWWFGGQSIAKLTGLICECICCHAKELFQIVRLGSIVMFKCPYAVRLFNFTSLDRPHKLVVCSSDLYIKLKAL